MNNKRFTCMIIDDDADDREIISEIITAEYPSIHCMAANGALDAFEQLTNMDTEYPAFIILDLVMPRNDGIFFLKSIAPYPALKQIPVVIYSTSARQMQQAKTILAAEQIEIRDYVIKPASWHELKATLIDVLRRLH